MLLEFFNKRTISELLLELNKKKVADTHVIGYYKSIEYMSS
jgi:hypothetical protein